MPKVTTTGSRKADHIRINLREDVRSGLTNGLERYHFVHEALPEINLDDVDISVNLFNKTLKAPILISSMTGGTKEAYVINQRLAIAAQKTGIAMGLGSQRIAIDHSEWASSFNLRKEAPDVLLFANLGIIQLNYGYHLEHCIRAVKMAEADGLILHLNALQEALQPEGDTNWGGILNKIEMVCTSLDVPVIVKEVGWGISGKTASQLINAGVRVIDVAGAGGTSWSEVEKYRIKNPRHARISDNFKNWGIPTAESIFQVRKSCPEAIIFASGGLRSGLDIAKTIALGATLGGMAGPFLKPASESKEKTIDLIVDIIREIRVTLFAVGSPNLGTLAGKLTRID